MSESSNLEKERAQIRRRTLAYHQPKLDVLNIEIEPDEGFSNLTKFERYDPVIRLKLLTPKSIDEIIEAGTSEEVGYLIAIHSSYVAYYMSSAADNLPAWEGIKEHERDRLRRRLTDDEIDEANLISATIRGLEKIDMNIEDAIKNFQWKAHALARFVAQKEAYETLIAGMNSFIKNSTIGNYTHVIRKAFSSQLKGDVTININNSKQGFFLEYGLRDGGLQDMIDYRREYLVKAIKEMRAYIDAVRIYFHAYDIPERVLFPNMAMCFEDMREEQLYRTLRLDRKFFKRSINERIAKGEKVTEKEIKEAVFPDVYDIEPDKHRVRNYYEGMVQERAKTLQGY